MEIGWLKRWYYTIYKQGQEAANHFAWFADFAAIDVPASSQKTRELLGWKPKQPGLIDDVDREQYFKT
jgi:hypothetical protein